VEALPPIRGGDRGEPPTHFYSSPLRGDYKTYFSLKGRLKKPFPSLDGRG